MTQTEMDKNLLVVTAIAGYAQNHNLQEAEVYKIFSQHNILNLIREQYDALHTQSLEETVCFVEDVMHNLEKNSINENKSMPQYFYNDQNITIDILLKIEHVVRILSEKYKSSFDDLLEKFYSSNTFRALKKSCYLHVGRMCRIYCR